MTHTVWAIPKNRRFLVEIDRFRARSFSNDLYNDVWSVGLIAECIYNKLQRKLNFAKTVELKKNCLARQFFVIGG